MTSDLRKLDGDDFNTIGNCFQAVYQTKNWTSEQHGPVGTSSYGFLLSVNGGNSQMQIFVDNTSKLAFRVKFSGNANWGKWTVVTGS